MRKEWEGFVTGSWTEQIDVEEFIRLNYKPYDGDDSFLAGPTERTKECYAKVQELLVAERKAGGTLKVDASRIMRINAFGPGYIVPGKDIIVGLQTDEPLKRGICPFGGIKMVREEVAEFGETLPEEIDKMFDYVTTHNDGVFKAYSKEMKQVRHLGFITGLPDAYGRGRIIGDYRRAALYGIDYLIEEKQKDHEMIASRHVMNEENIRTAEEVSNQIIALKEIKKMQNPTVSTSPDLLRTLRKLFSGLTSHTLLVSRKKTVLQCPSEELPLSSTSMLKETLQTAYTQKNRFRNSSMTLS